MRRSGGPDLDEATPLVAGDPSVPGDLLLVAGDGFFSTFPFERELVIGRGGDCDVVVEHRTLSRRHAILRPGHPVTVQDLDSTNGTRVGGELHHGGEPIALRANDSFHVGPFSFVLVTRAPGDDRSMSARDALQVSDPTPTGVSPLVRNIAGSTTSVVILGETGVGKEVLAETLHVLSGRAGALTRINCAALSESLLESELFGHEKGAFTGAAGQKDGLLEAADGGTVFLDELGELPLATQAKLLRVVERREVLRLGSTRPIPIDVRFVAATNRDLPAEVAAGGFRRDLYFRLDGITLVIPPLRERRGMIAPMALRFLEEARRRDGRSGRLAGDVLAALEAHGWPGNVRELKAVIDRAVLLARDGEIGVRHLSFARQAAMSSSPPPPVDAEPDGLDYLDDDQRADRARLLVALDECVGNQTRAAKKLGVSRTTLVHKLRLYRIPRPRT